MVRSLNESSTEYKKIVFIVVVVSAIVSLVTFMGLSIWTEFSAGNEKSEELEITSCLWSENLDSAIISIKNTGETVLERRNEETRSLRLRYHGEAHP